MPAPARHSVVVAAALLAVTASPVGAFAAVPLVAPAAPPRCATTTPPAKVVRDVPVAERLLEAERVRPLSSGRKVTVALLASGVDAGHPQLRGADIRTGADFLSSRGGGSGRYDCHGHGTAVASLIVGRFHPGVGTPSLAPGATILPVRVGTNGSDTSVAGDTATTGDTAGGHGAPGAGTATGDSPVTPQRLAQAVAWAVDRRVDVISVPVPVYEDDPALKRAVARAAAADVLVVASVGNDGDEIAPGTTHGRTPYPAAYPGVIGVNAVDDSLRPLGTRRGEEIDLVAPGQDVVAAHAGGGHRRYTGSGVATGFVTAVAALVASRHDAGGGEVAQRLQATASQAAGGPDRVGHGLVDPYRALTESVATGRPRPLTGLGAVGPDAAAVARAARDRIERRIALAVTGTALVLAVLIPATMTVWSRGRRRHWRPARAEPTPLPGDVGGPSASVRLFPDRRVR